MTYFIFLPSEKNKVHVVEQLLPLPDSEQRAVVVLVQSFAKALLAFTSPSPRSVCARAAARAISAAGAWEPSPESGQNGAEEGIARS